MTVFKDSNLDSDTQRPEDSSSTIVSLELLRSMNLLNQRDMAI
ncbi:hypothetical protein GYH30_044805 [Glycine max]|nr:hypothetical protein GYH30_044805 [Glycine max]